MKSYNYFKEGILFSIFLLENYATKNPEHKAIILELKEELLKVVEKK